MNSFDKMIKQSFRPSKVVGNILFNNPRKDFFSKNAWKKPEGFDPNTGVDVYGRKIVQIPTQRLYYMRAKYNIPNQKRATASMTLYSDDSKNRPIIQKYEDEEFDKRRQELRGLEGDRWHAAYNRVEAQSQKQAGLRFANEMREKYEQENPSLHIVMRHPKTTKYGDKIFKYDVRKTPEEHQKDVRSIMTGVSDSYYSGGKTQYPPGKSYEEKRHNYIPHLAKSIQSNDEFVPMLTLDRKELQYGVTGEGRHRILAAQQLGLRTMPVVVDENVDDELLDRYVPQDDRYSKNMKYNPEEYKRWKQNVNMTPSELQRFMSVYGNTAGLSRTEASSLGIKSGRDSARAIIRMKQKPVSQWNQNDIDWMRRQNSFVARMSAARGPLYNEKGQPTRKLLALKVWGHNPEKR